MIIPVVLSGGSGTRLWPLSRQFHPKQFLSFTDEESLFSKTLGRFCDDQEFADPLVICNHHHRFFVREELRARNIEGTILLEPEGRDTGAALTIAALWAYNQDPDAVVLSLHSDHLVENAEHLITTAKQATAAAQGGHIVTFGIVPTYPETGYGYIERDQTHSDISYHVARFREKPHRELAEEFLTTKKFYWNSGLFMFSAKTFLDEMQRCTPELLEACQVAYDETHHDGEFLRLQEAFSQCPKLAIDYALMEKSDRVVVYPLDDIGWTDLGNWNTVAEKSAQDTNGNATVGDTMIEDCQNCYVRSDHGLAAAVGLEDIIVVQSRDATIVTKRDRAHDIKKIVNRLKESEQRSEHQHHPTRYRPWGTYEQIQKDDNFIIRRIVVKPGASVSLQVHHHRAEHWIVVRGSAHVTRGAEKLCVERDQSTYIPSGMLHKLHNPSQSEELEMIEIQTGDVLSEHDVVRFSDELTSTVSPSDQIPTSSLSQ